MLYIENPGKLLPYMYNLNAVSEKILDVITSLKRQDSKPILIAIDGGNGSGKSSIAAIIGTRLKATLVVTDDFYASQVTDQEWLGRSHAQRAAHAMNWQSLRIDVLEPLLRGMRAEWNSFDFDAGAHADDSYAIKSDCTIYEPTDIIVLEGTYSARAELADLISLKILIDVPVALRHQRLSKREDKAFLAKWHERWDGAEQYYFRHVQPASNFDMVVENK